MKENHNAIYQGFDTPYSLQTRFRCFRCASRNPRCEFHDALVHGVDQMLRKMPRIHNVSSTTVRMGTEIVNI